MQDENHKPRNSKRVIWDQQKLLQTQKTRGMYKKIDQPKTPYVKNSGDGSGQQDNNPSQPKSQQEVQIDHNLQVAKHNQQVNAHKKINLQDLNAQLEKQLSSFRNQQSIQDEEQEQKARKRQEFNKKRASHYNEFQMIKQMKNHGWEDEEDEMG